MNPNAVLLTSPREALSTCMREISESIAEDSSKIYRMRYEPGPPQAPSCWSAYVHV